MGFFAQTAVESIREKVFRLREKDSPQRRLIVTTSTFPADETLDLAKILDGFAMEDGEIDVTFKVAQILADKWADNDELLYGELKARGWLDDTGNLTGYRNASPPENGNLGLAVLVGADKVLDASGLADFYRCGPASVWQQMGGSFDKWIRLSLDKAHVGYDGKTVEHFNTVLWDLVEQGCTDLFQISRLLNELPFTEVGAQDGREAEKVLLKNLERFQLPNLAGFKFVGRKKIRPFLEQAIRFFRYDLYLEESKRRKALSTIEKLLDQKDAEIAENMFFTPEERGVYKTDKEFIEAVHRYVREETLDDREKLWHSDFIALQEKILKFKPTREKSTRKSVRKLSGGPVEVVLTALWETLRECRVANKTNRPEITEIVIKGDKFKYDTDALLEGGQASAAETQELARDYLRKLVGGVDRFFQTDYLNVSLGSDQDVSATSNLFHEEIELTNARTAEPLLEFRVELKFVDEGKTKKKFAWRLPETQSHRMAEELIEWAASGMDQTGGNLHYLPVFHTRYHEELMRAKDDEETSRVLLHAIRDVDADSTNLLTREWLATREPLLDEFKLLARAYRHFMVKARTDGLHSVFHKDKDQGESNWDQLRKAYEASARAYMSDDDQYRKSPVAPMLMRAFLIVAPRKDKQNLAWVTHSHESSGVATVLHPSVCEMMLARILFLFACFNYAAPREWASPKATKPFHPSKWQDYLDLSGIQFPIAGLIKDRNRAISTEVEGKELIHRIGSTDTEDAPLSTRLLLRYEGFDDEDIADSEMFAETRESRLLVNLLSDYLDTHPHARDGISLAIYRNTDIQPVISGMHAFLERLGKDNVIGEERPRPFSVSITVFSEAGEDVGISRWMEQWKERWEAAESESRFAVYRYCRFSIAHRVVPSEKSDRQDFARMIKDSLDVDIAVLYDFISAGFEGNDFQGVRSYDVRERTLKFPIVEKSFCMVKDPELELTRSRVISNPQFVISSLHLETMARIRNENTPSGQEHVLIGYGDYTPWQLVVDELHKHAEWVVCIDASSDDTLIKKRRHQDGTEREIIGFGSGVGAHGQLNFTVSTEHFKLSDILFRLKRSISELYQGWDQETLGLVSKSVLTEAQTLSGLSLIRATGVGHYIRDFMGYALANKLLPDAEDLLCARLISLDAYRHWFTGGDERRPDLLWLKAKLDEDGRIRLDMGLIECKLGQQNDDYVEKAISQIRNGLASLIPAFMPKVRKKQDDDRPDQRYWWLQLHRLISSKAEITRQKQDTIMAAMERLVDGDYSISWQGAVLTFWTDSRGEDLEKAGTAIFENSQSGRLEFGLYAVGQEAVRRICVGDKQLKIPWDDSALQFGFSSKESEKETETHDDENAGESEEDETWDKDENIETTEFEVTGEEEKHQKSEVQPVRIPDRIMIGKTVSGNREVYWEFGHKELANRHMLIFGASGMGKTYAIQCLLCELGRNGQNSLIVDYTNGFLPNQLEKEVNEVLSPTQHFILQSPLPINPFRIQSIDHGGFVAQEKISTVAKRIAAIFQTVYGLGEQQFAVLYSAISQGISEFEQRMSLAHLLKIIESFIDDATKNKSAVQTTLSKLRPFVDDNPFGGSDRTLDWKSIFEDPKERCHIFQLAGLDFHSWRLVTEFVLWDFYGFLQTYGQKNLPKVVVLDEVQNLDHKDGSPLSKYLREGRKFGVSLIMATQIMSNLNKDERDRMFNAGHKLFFRPADTEMKAYAEIAAVSTKEKPEIWLNRLSELKKGECYSLGSSENTSTGKLESKAFHIHVASLEERFSNV